MDRAFDTHVAKPLGMKETCFLPDRTLDIVNANPTDEKRAWFTTPTAAISAAFAETRDCFPIFLI